MKKKFVLTLALVLMVAASLMAATPLELSGSFKTGYKFMFGTDTDAVSSEYIATITGSVASDFWKVSVSGGADGMKFGKQNSDGNYYGMKAELYLDKALAEKGVDLGDLGLTLNVGEGVSGSAYTVLANKAGFSDDVALQLDAVNTFGVAVSYGKLVKLYAAVNPIEAGLYLASAQVTPVEGVDVTVGYSSNFTDDLDTQLFSDVQALEASAAFDVKKLADLDFALAATGEFLMDLTNSKYMITADVAGEYEGIGLFVAYQNTLADVNKLAAKASYSTKIEDIGLSASFRVDLKNLAALTNNIEYTVAAGANYTLGGAKYALDAKYEIKGKKVSLTPTVSFSF